MKSLKPFFYGIIFGVALGLWFGVNIGKNKTFYSNPFAPANLEGVLRDKSGKIIKKSGEVLEKGGEALERKGDQLRQKME